MRRIVVLLASFAVAIPAAHAQEGPATVDPGMTKAQVVERLGAPAAERARGEYTYLFYPNGCERTCGMTDLVTLQSDTVIDAIFRAPHRHYAGTSSSPTPHQPGSARGRTAPLGIPAQRPAEPVRASMADEFAELLGSSRAPGSSATTKAPVPASASPASAKTPGKSILSEIAELLGHSAPPSAAAPVPASSSKPAPKQAPANAISSEIAELLGNPAPPTTETTPAAGPGPKAAGAARAAKPVLSSEIAELLGNPAAAAAPVTPASAKGAPNLTQDVMDLLRDPSASPASAKPAAAQPAQPGEAVRGLPRPDTIKASGRAGGATSAWPPPREQSGAEAKKETERAKEQPAAKAPSTWPPSKDPSEAKPAPDRKPAASPDTTTTRDKPKGTTWTTWPPPAM